MPCRRWAAAIFRYNGVTTGLGNGIYAIYTEQPFLTVTRTTPAKSMARMIRRELSVGYGISPMETRESDRVVCARCGRIGLHIRDHAGHGCVVCWLGITFTGGQTLAITKANLTATVASQSKTYGADDPALAAYP